MKKKLLKIFELPAKAKIGILLGTLSLVSIAFYTAVYQDTITEVETHRVENQTIRDSIAAKTKLIQNLSRYEERVALLELELDKAVKELPNQKELDELLSRVSDKAKESGLDIKLFLPAGEVPKGFYAEVPVNLTVLGTYHEVATFFDEIAHLERVVNLDKISMRNPVLSDNAITLEISAVVSGYRFLENFIKERADSKAERDKAEAKRKRRGG